MDELCLPYYKPILTNWHVFACSLTILTWTGQGTGTSHGKAFLKCASSHDLAIDNLQQATVAIYQTS